MRQLKRFFMVGYRYSLGLVFSYIFLGRVLGEPGSVNHQHVIDLSFSGGTLTQLVQAINNAIGLANGGVPPAVVIDDSLPQVLNWAGRANEVDIERILHDENERFAQVRALTRDPARGNYVTPLYVRGASLSDIVEIARYISAPQVSQVPRVSWQRETATLHLYPPVLAIVEHKLLRPSMCLRTSDLYNDLYWKGKDWGRDYIIARSDQYRVYIVEEPEHHIQAVRMNLLPGGGIRPWNLTMVGYSGPDYIRQAVLLEGFEDDERAGWDPVRVGLAPLTSDEALAAWRNIRDHAHRRRVLETIRELVDQAENVPENANAVKREYWRISDLIWFRKFKMEYDLEERAAELRIIYARLAENAKETQGMIPSDLMAKVGLPDEVDATAYRILEVPSIDGMTQGVALCINERLWLMDGLEVNEVYAVPPEVGRDSFNIPYGRHIRMPYGQYLDRRAAGEQLELEGMYEFFYDPRVVVLMGDGLVRTVGKKDFAVLLEEDAATRARLGLPSAPEGLSEKYFGMVDDRFKEYTITADPFGPD